MDEFYVSLYQSIHDVIRAESVLKSSGIPCELVPVPTSVRSDCGMALALPPREVERAFETLRAAGALPQGLYFREASGQLRSTRSILPPPGESGSA